MKKIILFILSIILLSSCNTSDKISEKDIPKEADLYAKTFVNNLIIGEIDTCYAQFDKQFQNLELKKFLLKLNQTILNKKMIGLSILQYSINSIYSDNPMTQYELVYEYHYPEFYLYYTFLIQKVDGKMSIYHLNISSLNKSIKEINRFTFKDKGFIHYFFFIIMILIPLFIIITIIFCFKTPMKRKWLWILFILIGFVGFKLNWTTGYSEIQLVHFKILGAGFIKYGAVNPWIVSFSIPLGAILFWVKRARIKRKKLREFEESIDNTIQTL